MNSKNVEIEQWRGNYFWTEAQNRERQIDGIFIEFGPRSCPRNKRSLKKGLRRIWTAFFADFRLRLFGSDSSQGGASRPGGPKYFQGGSCPPTYRAYEVE